MRGIARMALPALLVTGLTIMTSGPAWAAAPTNDDFANATVVTVSPFTDGPVSTVEATTQATDPVACAGAAHSVWYRYTADHTGSMSFDTFGSSFDTALSAYTGTEGALSLVACNDDAANGLQSQITFDITAGTTYAIMAVGCCTTGGASGDLVVNAQVSAGPFTFDVSFSSGSVDLKTHAATVNGGVVCNEPGVVNVAGELQQRGALGSFSAEVACSPNRTTFTAAVSSSVGSFMPGRATVRDVTATGCGTLDCDVLSLGGGVATIKLSP